MKQSGCDHRIPPSDAASVTGFSMQAALLDDAKAKLRMIRDEPRFELLLPSEANALLDYIDALEDDHPRKATYRV